MDPIEFRMEMDLSGCVRLYHPSHPHIFYVMEQKLDKDTLFIPLEQGVYVFYIDEDQPFAIKTTHDDLPSVYAFLETKIRTEGWRPMDAESPMDIRKKNLIKWQLCDRII